MIRRNERDINGEMHECSLRSDAEALMDTLRDTHSMTQDIHHGWARFGNLVDELKQMRLNFEAVSMGEKHYAAKPVDRIMTLLIGIAVALVSIIGVLVTGKSLGWLNIG